MLGVAIVELENDWRVVDLEDVGGKPKVVSETDVHLLASRLGLLPFERVFESEDSLIDFLRQEYLLAHKGSNPAAASQSIEDDLDFLDKRFVMDWLRDLQHCLDTEQFDTVAPRRVLRNLEALARHPRFEIDAELLVLLTPLKDAWERRFALHSI